MTYYAAIIHKDHDSDYGVSFPDLPGCVTAGVSLDEARAMAEEALQLHVAGLIEDGQPVPSPSSLDAIMDNPEFADGAAVLIPLRPTPKTVRVNITVVDETLRAIDAYAETHGFTRSGFLVAAAKRAMETS